MILVGASKKQVLTFSVQFSTLKLVIEKHQNRFIAMNEIVASVLQINVWERDAVQ